VGNFGVSEAQIVVAATVASTAFGWMAGRNIYKMQGPSAAMGGLIGFSGGMGLAMQNSWGARPACHVLAAHRPTNACSTQLTPVLHVGEHARVNCSLPAQQRQP
jgi:hypothetical protein